MKKILLILALTLLWSFNVSAQLKQGPDGKVVYPSTKNEVGKVNDDCRTSLTADEAYKSTADGNVNTFGATYSTVTPRTCEEKAALSEPVVASCHSCNCNPRYCLR